MHKLTWEAPHFNMNSCKPMMHIQSNLFVEQHEIVVHQKGMDFFTMLIFAQDELFEKGNICRE